MNISLFRFTIIKICFLPVSVFSLLTGCVSPPASVGPQVIPQDEFRFVSIVYEGEAALRQGRLYDAEKQFRLALLRYPKNPVVLNNLGYVLLGQNRLREAEKYFVQALNVAPLNLAVRDNIARTLYQMEEYEKAQEAYETLFDVYYRLSAQERKIQGFSLGKLWNSYANLGQLMLSRGFVDEAACIMRDLAFSSNGRDYAGLYVRMLLAAGDANLALDFIDNRFSLRGEAVPSWLAFDKASAQLVLGKSEEAKQLLEVTAASRTSSKREYIGALVLMSELNKNTDEDVSNQPLLQRVDLVLKDNSVCSRLDSYFPYYWHPELLDMLLVSVEEHCSGRIQR
jgi:tetratricopeptide (TPR) repeat protein